MFISPEIAIKEGWITHPRCSTYEDWDENKFLCPNAIDFTVDKVFSIASGRAFVISEAGKVMRGGAPFEPVVDRANPDYSFWNLHPETVWDCLSDVYVKLPEGVACQLIIRSTFSRNGLFLTSGLYDSGFEGHVGFALHNPIGRTKIATGTRIGQIIFVESKNAKMYEGGYNHAVGTNAHQESN